MAITAAIPTNGNFGSDTDANSFASNSITFGASGRLFLVAAHCQSTSGTPPNISAITGSSVSSSVSIATLNWSTEYKLALWAGISTGSAGAITVAYGGTTIAGMRGKVVEFTNVDTAQFGGGLADGILQVGTNTSSGTAQSVTLTALNDATNATFAVYGGGGADTRTPKSGWTELGDTTFTPRNNADIELQWIAAGDTASQATATGANFYGAIAVEIAQTGTTPPGSTYVRPSITVSATGIHRAAGW